ncbi:ABC1 kinase family protein [Sinosporangium siamense]|uniref:Ubiquinone biosynthesis protein UbiB n=1 Tax=Sinosporangium siamense TaxID=1367973 RepID=A0A919V8L6_9ACTN|nr:AarF/UbiB family protein [Sinosporangium siamense]GII94578.1 ubiquinone biosynthesis protein UbiB [Sinosporangium siamense]
MFDFFSLIGTVTWAVLAALVGRRLLGVPVGWPRSIAVGFLVIFTLGNVWVFLAETIGIVRDDALTVSLFTGTLLFLLVGVWVFVLGVTVLVLLEVLVPTGTLPSVKTLFTGWKARRRRSKRYAQIMAIAVKHGLGGYMRGRRRLESGSKTARSLRDALNEGGVTFVKLGQMLSTRPDLLPPAFITQLSTLQTKAVPEPWSRIEPAIAGALGRPVGEVFAHIDETPLASASVAQVHRATLADGREVVVKVQRPGARAQVTADLEIILRLSRWLTRSTPWGRSLRVDRLAEGFADSLHEELDYTVELDNMRAVAGSLAADPGSTITIPTAHENLCGPTLMVMDRLEGAPVGPSSLSGLAPAVRADIARRLLREVLNRIVVTGVFHADLHPGNIFVTSGGRVGLLDFGSVGRLDEPTRTALGMLLLAIDRDDSIAAADALIEMLDRPESLVERDLERAIGQLMLRYRAGFGRMGSAGMFGGLFALINDFRFAIPPQIAAAFRALAALDGTLTMISPDIDVVALAREQGREMMRASTSPEAVRADLEDRLAAFLPVLQRLPRRINKITEDIEQGRLSINIRPLADPRDRRFLTDLVHRVVVTVMAATATLAAILLMTSTSGPKLTEDIGVYHFLGWTLLLVGFTLALRSIALAFRSPPD